MKKPKTIADLTLNLGFTKGKKFPTYSNFQKDIKKENHNIDHYIISPGIYSFIVPFFDYEKWEPVNKYFDIIFHQNMNRNIINLLYKINYHVYKLTNTICKKYNLKIGLDKFILKENNVFKLKFTIDIHNEKI